MEDEIIDITEAETEPEESPRKFRDIDNYHSMKKTHKNMKQFEDPRGRGKDIKGPLEFGQVLDNIPTPRRRFEGHSMGKIFDGERPPMMGPYGERPPMGPNGERPPMGPNGERPPMGPDGERPSMRPEGRPPMDGPREGRPPKFGPGFKSGDLPMREPKEHGDHHDHHRRNLGAFDSVYGPQGPSGPHIEKNWGFGNKRRLHEVEEEPEDGPHGGPHGEHGPHGGPHGPPHGVHHAAGPIILLIVVAYHMFVLQSLKDECETHE